jgi:hypothetical protein
MREQRSWSPSIFRKKHTSYAYNINLKLDAVCLKKRGKYAIDIASAVRIPDMIHTLLKSPKEIETNGC